MLYDRDGQPIRCGNCLWGQPDLPFILLPTSRGNGSTCGSSVSCQRDPRRGYGDFVKMQYDDHCSRHALLAGKFAGGLARHQLLVPVDFPVDYLQTNCPSCEAKFGEQCLRGNRPRRPRPNPHDERVEFAREKAWREFLPECSRCGSEPGKPCVAEDGRELSVIHYTREISALSAAIEMLSRLQS